MLLLNCLYAAKGTPLYSLAQVLTRMETLANVLVWSKDVHCKDQCKPVSIDLVQLPKFKLNFSAQLDHDNIRRLYSVDHSDLFVSNTRRVLVEKLICGLPHR